MQTLLGSVENFWGLCMVGTRYFESTEKVKPTFRLKVNNGEIVVLPFFFCLS